MLTFYLIGVLLALLMLRVGYYAKQAEGVVLRIFDDHPEAAVKLVMAVILVTLTLFSWVTVLLNLGKRMQIRQLMRKERISWRAAVDKYLDSKNKR